MKMIIASVYAHLAAASMASLGYCAHWSNMAVEQTCAKRRSAPAPIECIMQERPCLEQETLILPYIPI